MVLRASEVMVVVEVEFLPETVVVGCSVWVQGLLDVCAIEVVVLEVVAVVGVVGGDRVGVVDSVVVCTRVLDVGGIEVDEVALFISDVVVVDVDGMLDVEVAASDGMLDVVDAIAAKMVVDSWEVAVRVDVAVVVGGMDVVEVVDVLDLVPSTWNVDVIGVVVDVVVEVLVDDSGDVDVGFVVVTVGELVVPVVVDVGDAVDVLVDGFGVVEVVVEDVCVVGMFEVVVRMMFVVEASDVVGRIDVVAMDVVVDVGGTVDVSDEVENTEVCTATDETCELSVEYFATVV